MRLLLYYLILVSFPTSKPSVDVCLNKEELRLYKLINDYRKEKRLPPISFSAKLTMVAQAHAVDLAENYQFDPQGKCNPHSWSKNGQWTSCCYTNDHKKAQCMWDKPNEIADYGGHGYEIAYYSSAGANAKEGMNGWKKSPGHNPLLINSGTWKQVEWKGLGVGVYKEYAVVWFGAVADDQNTMEQCRP